MAGQPNTQTLIGEVLVALGYLKREQLNEVMRAQKAGEHPGKKFGEIAVEKGFLTEKQVELGLKTQAELREWLAQQQKEGVTPGAEEITNRTVETGRRLEREDQVSMNIPEKIEPPGTIKYDVEDWSKLYESNFAARRGIENTRLEPENRAGKAEPHRLA